MNDKTSGTQTDDEAFEVERRPNASEVDADEHDADDDALTDELERSHMGGTERLGGTP